MRSVAAFLRALGPVVVIGDGHRVNLYGDTFRFSRGDTQRRIIIAIYESYLVREFMTPWVAIVATLDLPLGARFRDYFKKSRPPVLGRLLREEAGLVGFNLRQ